MYKRLILQIVQVSEKTSYPWALELIDYKVNFCQASDGCQMQIVFTGKLLCLLKGPTHVTGYVRNWNHALRDTDR